MARHPQRERPAGRRATCPPTPCGASTRCGRWRTSRWPAGRCIAAWSMPSARSSWPRADQSRAGLVGRATVAAAIEAACQEMIAGALDEHVVVDALQGGAGTSTNMNVNEVLANRALQLARPAAGRLRRCSIPHDDINLHQSTNDTYPTALRVAAISGLRELERKVVALLEAFQEKEKEFADVVKIGRTEVAGRRADDARPRDGRLCRGLRPRPLANLQVRGAAAGGEPRRHGHRHRPGRTRGSTSSASSSTCGRSPAWGWPGRRTSSRPRRTPTPSSRSAASSAPWPSTC